ncbi:MAG: SLC13 family permease [Clostridiales bacterium]|nr:SLC13 family permease [Clostridiales bacterium]
MFIKHKNIVYIILGVVLATTIILVMPSSFAMNARVALGVIALMIFWWITRPVHLAVTALIPLVVNSFYEMIPMKDMLIDYASPIILLILGASILTSAWTLHGLDKRVALKSLTIIGTSVRKQIAIWFILSVIMSAFMPNMVVVTALCPIAYSMVKYSNSSENSTSAYLLLLAIAWGAGIGGFATPMGGAMNLVAISNIETYTGTEFFYGEWVLNVLPYLVVLSIGTVIFLLLIKRDEKSFSGSKVFYQEQLAKLNKLSKAEIISLVLLGVAIVLSFTRPFYQKILPGFKPPYAFLLLGLLSFFIKSGDGKRIMEWKYASKNINWGLIVLFAGGLAIGGLIIDTGAAAVIANLMSDQGNKLIFILVIVAVGMFLANTSSNTAACAVLIPIVISVSVGLGSNPMPYVFLAAAACNSAFALPTSIRAVPIGYGLDTGFMFKKGIGAITVSYIVLVVTGYIFIMLV